MAKFDKYDVLMKMLEVIASDAGRALMVTSEEEKRKIINVIGNIEGSVLIQQILSEETSVDIGDKFENISQSIIATRGSIATGIVKVRAAGDHDIANALEKLEKAIHEAPTSEMSEESKSEAFQLLDEFTKQASSPSRVKTIMKTLGNGLWQAIKSVDSVSKAMVLVWPVIERLWM